MSLSFIRLCPISFLFSMLSVGFRRARSFLDGGCCKVPSHSTCGNNSIDPTSELPTYLQIRIKTPSTPLSSLPPTVKPTVLSFSLHSTLSFLRLSLECRAPFLSPTPPSITQQHHRPMPVDAALKTPSSHVAHTTCADPSNLDLVPVGRTVTAYVLDLASFVCSIVFFLVLDRPLSS